MKVAGLTLFVTDICLLKYFIRGLGFLVGWPEFVPYGLPGSRLRKTCKAVLSLDKVSRFREDIRQNKMYHEFCYWRIKLLLFFQIILRGDLCPALGYRSLIVIDSFILCRNAVENLD